MIMGKSKINIELDKIIARMLSPAIIRIGIRRTFFSFERKYPERSITAGGSPIKNQGALWYPTRNIIKGDKR